MINTAYRVQSADNLVLVVQDRDNPDYMTRKAIQGIWKIGCEK